MGMTTMGVKLDDATRERMDISRYQQNAITEQQELWHGYDHHGG